MQSSGDSPGGAGLVLVLVAHAAGGLDVEVAVQLVDQHQVDVEFATVQLQTQVAQALHLQQRTLQGVHRRHLDTGEDKKKHPSHTHTHTCQELHIHLNPAVFPNTTRCTPPLRGFD